MSTLPPDQSYGFADDAGRYRLDGRIATGGMGEVWRCTDTVLGREVAVKLLKNEFADDAGFRTRFEIEAQHAASLHHPNIATVYDVGEAQAADGSGVRRPYLVMELVAGQPLSALLRPGQPMDPVATRELLSQAADGLGAAHAAGIVHRDVKPANLLVTPDRRVKVTDFGIARAAEGLGLTSTGEVMGTPQYLSPEQAQGLTVTPASDVYALGVVAFECLGRRPPFVGDTPVATALAHLRDPIPELPPTVPGDLAAVVRHCLSKDPTQRYADGQALASALRDPATAAMAIPPAVVAPATQVMPAVAPEPTAAVPVQSDRSRAWMWALIGAIAVVLAVILAIWLVNRDTGDDDPGDDQTSQSPTPSESESSSPSEPTTTPPTEPAAIVLNGNDYIGRPLGDVERELGDLGLSVNSQQVDNPGGEIQNDVSTVNPTGTVQPGATITVTYWGPEPPPPPTSESPSETASEPPADEESTASDTATPSD